MAPARKSTPFMFSKSITPGKTNSPPFNLEIGNLAPVNDVGSVLLHETQHGVHPQVSQLGSFLRQRSAPEFTYAAAPQRTPPFFLTSNFRRDIYFCSVRRWVDGVEADRQRAVN